MEDFPHNQARPFDILENIFESLRKFERKYIFNRKKTSAKLKYYSLNSSLEKNRGISIYTPSKEKDPNRITQKTSQDKDIQFYTIYSTLKI